MTRTSAVNHLDVVDRVVSKVANRLVVSKVVSSVAKKERKIWKTTRSWTPVNPADRIAADRIAN